MGKAKFEEIERNKQYDLLQDQISKRIPGAGYGYDQTCHFVIVMEDQGYAFGYMRHVIEHIFPYLRVYMVQSCRFRGMQKTLEWVVNNKGSEQFGGYLDYCILMYDSGNFEFLDTEGRNRWLSVIVNIEKILQDNFSKYSIVQPQCFEEYIIQIMNLDKLINMTIDNDLYKRYVELMRNDIQTIDFDTFKNKAEQDERLIEDQVQQITDASKEYAVRHNSGYFGSCWITECRCINRQCQKDFKSEYKQKNEYVMYNQLLYIVIRQIENCIGHRIHQKNSMNDLIYNNKYIRQLWRQSDDKPDNR